MSKKSENRWVVTTTAARFIAAGKTWPQPGLVEVVDSEGDKEKVEAGVLALTKAEFKDLQNLAKRAPRTITLTPPGKGDEKLAAAKTRVKTEESKAEKASKELAKLKKQLAATAKQQKDMDALLAATSKKVEAQEKRAQSLDDEAKKNSPSSKTGLAFEAED